MKISLFNDDIEKLSLKELNFLKDEINFKISKLSKNKTKDLKINTHLELSKRDLKLLKNDIENIVPNKYKEKLNDIIEYNLGSKTIKDTKSYKNSLQTLKKYISNYKNIQKIDKNIQKIILNSNFILTKNIKLTLSYLYNTFCSENNNYLDELEDIFEQDGLLTHIKVYDFYKNKEDTNQLISKIDIEKNIKIKNLVDKLAKHNNNVDIKILTHMSTDKSFDIYKRILNDQRFNNISIKYIPESASTNIYIPSLFFILIKYQIPNSRNYKEIVLYLEDNRNWGVLENTFSTGFAGQFVKLLNGRFDEQFDNNNKIVIKAEEKKLDSIDFENNIKKILKDIDKFTNEETVEELDKTILREIHKLKTKYKTINNAYKFIKSYYYFVSYLHIIQNKIKNENLPNTNIVIKNIIDNLYYKKIKNMFYDIYFYHTNKLDIDITKTRRVIIEMINNKQAICDIFPDMNWLNKEDIIYNLNKILQSEKLLDKFFLSIDYNTKNMTKKEKIEFFKEFIINPILLGNKIELKKQN